MDNIACGVSSLWGKLRTVNILFLHVIRAICKHKMMSRFSGKNEQGGRMMDLIYSALETVIKYSFNASECFRQN